MDTIYRGDIASPGGRRNAWLDALFVDHAVLRFVWTNFHPVVPGRLFRSNHPTPGRIARDVRRHGIRSIVNLRGQTGNGSDALSREQAARLHLRFIDIPMRSRAALPRDILVALVEALETAPQPILVHCKSGADRAGFAAAVFLILQGTPADDALRHLSLRYGHMKTSRAGILGALVRHYRDTAEGRIGFAQWARTEYDPAMLSAAAPAAVLQNIVNDRILRRE